MADLTIGAVAQAAQELANGPQRPSLLYALWAGILSPQKPLDMNCTQAHALRKYVRTGLPTDDAAELVRIIKANGGHGWVYDQHAKSLINADYLYRSGRIAHLERKPRTMREWLRWRREMVRIHGVSWKVASFIALIMWPLESPFVPVDSHVCTRLGEEALYRSGKLSKKTACGYKLYRGLERRVYAEWRAVGKPYTITIWHWFMWEWQRVSTGDASGDGVESHALLCAREW